jgi:hypothetical protein
MIPQLTSFLTSKGYKLMQHGGDLWMATAPSGKSALCNFRWKSKPVWGIKAKRWEWSVPLIAWERYLDKAVKFLFVLETSTGIVHAVKLLEVLPEARLYDGDDLDRGGTVFLPVAAYHQVGKV